MEKYKDLKNNKNFLEVEEKTPEFYLLSGDRYYLLSDFALAISEYKKAEDICAENPEYKYRIGRALLQLGNFTEARIYFQKAILLEPGRAEFYNALSYTSHCLGNFKEAFENSLKAFELSPGNSLFRYNLAVIKMEIVKDKKDYSLDSLDSIGREYRKAGIENLDVDINKVFENFSTLGLLYFSKGAFEEARDWFLRASKLIPEKGAIYINIATIDLLEGNYKEAIFYFKKSFDLKANVYSAIRGLALSYEKQGNINMAIMEYERLLKLEPQDEFARTSLNKIYQAVRVENMSNSFVNLCRIYLKDGELEKAFYELQNAIKMGGETFELVSEINRVGLYLLIKGREASALRLYEKAAMLLKKLYRELKRKYQKKDWTRGFEYIFPLHKADMERIVTYRMLRDIYYNRKLYTIAHSWHDELWKAIKEIPSNFLLYDTKKLDKLVYEIAEAVKTSWFTCPEFYKIMGEINIYRSELNDALACYRKAAKLCPEEPSYLLATGNCLFSLKKYKEASLEYIKVLALEPARLIDNRDCLINLFKVLHKDDFCKFEAACLENIRIASHNSGNYFLLGELYLQKGKIEPSVKAFENALRLSFPKKLYLNSLASAYLFKGEELYKNNNFDEAKEFFSMAFSFGSEDEIAWRAFFFMGLICYKQNSLEKALIYFLKLKYSSPEFRLKAYRYMGIIYELQNIPEKAEYYNREFLEEINIKAREQLITMEHNFLLPAKESYIFEDIAAYERAIELEPERILYYILLVNLYENIQQLEVLSKKFFKKVFENFLYARIFIYTGRVFCRKNLLDKARLEYTKAIDAGLKADDLAASLNELAMKYYEQAGVRETKDILKEAIKCTEYYFPAYYNLGNIYYSLGRFDKARELFDYAFLFEKNREEKSKILNVLGKINLKLGKLPVAREKFEKSIEINPENIDGFYYMAMIDGRWGRKERAIEYLLKVLDLDPYHFKSIKYLRDLYGGEDDFIKNQWQEQLVKLLKIKFSETNFEDKYLFSEDLEEILIEYEKAFPLTLKDVKYFKKLAFLYMREERLEETSRAVEKCTNLNPDMAYLHIELSHVYTEAGHGAEAEKEALKAIEGGMKTIAFSEICIKIGNKFLHEGELEKARLEYEKAWDMGNRSKQLALKINKIGVEYSSTGNIDGAIEQFKKSINIKPDNFVFYKNLGTMYQRKGLLKDAIKSFEEASSIKDDDIKILEKLKTVYQEAGYFKKSIKILKKLRKLKPKNSTYLLVMAKIYQDIGRYKKALECYKETVTMKKEWTLPYMGVAGIYIEQSLFVRARKALQEVLKSNPHSGKALALLAYIYKQENELSLSYKYYNEAMDVYMGEIQKKDVPPSVFVELGDLFLYGLHIDKAIEYYEKALDVKEEDIMAIMKLGKTFFIKGEIEESELYLKKLTVNNVELPEAYFYSGDICYIKGMKEQAIDFYREVIRLAPDWLYKAYEKSGKIYSELNEKELAGKCYKKARYYKNPEQAEINSVMVFQDIKKVIETMEKDLKDKKNDYNI